MKQQPKKRRSNLAHGTAQRNSPGTLPRVRPGTLPGYHIPDFIVSRDGSSQTLLARLAGQRDRAKEILPELLSIDAGLYGSGKEAIDGCLSSKPAPESAEQILAELTSAMDEIQQVTSRIYGRL